MNTQNIGQFIQILRKEKGLTQKELAEIIGMSDKTISKWENGNSLPDTSMLLPLCKALDISVNELLSCERIAPEDYSMKAEETIITLVKENESHKRGNLISQIVGILLLVFSTIFLFINTPYGYEGLVIFPKSFIDMPSLIMIFLLVTGILLATKTRGKRSQLLLINKIIVPVGALLSLISAIVMLTKVDDISNIGRNLYVLLLSLVYAFVIKIIVEVMLAKFE